MTTPINRVKSLVNFYQITGLCDWRMRREDKNLMHSFKKDEEISHTYAHKRKARMHLF